MKLTLVSGAARSGKSQLAEQLAARATRVTYVATGWSAPDDADWQVRLARHRERRPSYWGLVETGVPGGPTLEAVLAEAEADECLLIDSLGGWLGARLLTDFEEESLARAVAALPGQLHRCAARVIAVSEEVGWGVIPAYPLGRRFRDLLGALNRNVAREADAAYLVANGYALDLKVIGRAIDQF
ncbi:bifunctional adenosylcobinamide kinase/adenosylcobinamide-phosphate guanylyltransferase [Gloeobacter morelensis]|uniref:Adenosylcobinamide kinase n=1 Tax=Gloeobacter morelensis MG652769 TaxID=2781736 RepID=A0ABY3PHW1_9CYAN|nr:bifunctional adenosylcobinamide kinase/adenosylcobinamide-phosphate guanylyltransferase [Gloeobacter morelensis]UFP93224.1 bifunctional adenosylcobinamide kinase/adenosylcobinamide-phosphate guanylyltransferase [Gloeobacter morelensis MG652769]